MSTTNNIPATVGIFNDESTNNRISESCLELVRLHNPKTVSASTNLADSVQNPLRDKYGNYFAKQTIDIDGINCWYEYDEDVVVKDSKLKMKSIGRDKLETNTSHITTLTYAMGDTEYSIEESDKIDLLEVGAGLIVDHNELSQGVQRRRIVIKGPFHTFIGGYF